MYFYFDEVNNIQTINKNQNKVFLWEGKEDYESNKCHVYIYRITRKTAVFIVTDIHNLPSMKMDDITNKIIFFASHAYDLSPEQIMLVEHYSPVNLSKQDIYLQVQVMESKTIRYEIGRNRLIELVEKNLYRQS